MAARRFVLFVVTMALLTLGWQGAAGASANETVALYQMNEPAGSTVLVDSSGNGINGMIGADVTAGATFDGATGHRFPFRQPNTPPAYPGHTNSVAHDPRLNPGTEDFAFTIRMRTTRSFGNVVQKGQSTVPGGYFKMENPGGVPTCLFRGVDGQRGVSAGRDLSNGQWHTIRCERTATGAKMTVDGVVAQFNPGTTGSISNDWPLSIAGKASCNQITVTYDYFAGDIDYIRFESGGVTDVSPPSRPGTPVATSSAAGRVDLSWGASTDDIATTLNYLVFRDGADAPVGSVSGGTTGTINFTDTGRTPGAQHTYKVRANDGTNNGPRSSSSPSVTVAGTISTTTTTAPATTTTTRPPTTTVPPNPPPSGRVDSVTVGGSSITVRGRATDPSGTPIAQIVDVVNGRRTVYEQWAIDGTFGWMYNASPGTHRVCVNVLDTPDRNIVVPLSCQDVVVK